MYRSVLQAELAPLSYMEIDISFVTLATSDGQTYRGSHNDKVGIFRSLVLERSGGIFTNSLSNSIRIYPLCHVGLHFLNTLLGN
jgi:hypothetical protein